MTGGQASTDASNAELAILAERMALAQEACGLGIHDFAVQSGTIEWDSAGRAIWGFAPEESITYEVFAATVHPDDLPAVEAAVARACDPAGPRRYTATYRIFRRDGAERTVEATGIVHFDGHLPRRLIGTVRDVSDEIEARRELERTRRFVQDLIESSPTLLYIYDLVEQRNVFIGPQIRPITRMAPEDYARLEADLIPSVIHPDDLPRVREHHAAIRERRIEPPFEIEYRLRTADDDWVWLSSSEVVHLRDPDGRPRQILGASLDITRRHEAEEQRELLLGELAHRIGNTIALVQSLAALTVRKSCDPAAWQRFERWLVALAAAQRPAGEDWRGGDFGELVEQILAPFDGEDGGRIGWQGPPATLERSRCLMIGLALHELATNSLKYGALSVGEGRVEIAWRTDGELIALDWTEVGGPPARPPMRTGFGTKLVQSVSRKGSADFRYTPQGFSCSLLL